MLEGGGRPFRSGLLAFWTLRSSLLDDALALTPFPCAGGAVLRRRWRTAGRAVRIRCQGQVERGKHVKSSVCKEHCVFSISYRQYFRHRYSTGMSCSLGNAWVLIHNTG